MGTRLRPRSTGKDEWEKIAASQQEVLITDNKMPRMSGKELGQQIQASMPDRLFPIFITTSLTAHEHRDWSSAISNLFFVEKPISLRKLRTSLAEISLPPKSVTGGLAQ